MRYALILALALLAACASTPETSYTIRRGEAASSVRAKLGEPDAWHISGKAATWYYDSGLALRMVEGRVADYSVTHLGY